MMLSRPRATSATSATILVVPMSRPTMSSLLSLLMVSLCFHFSGAARIDRAAQIPFGYRISTTVGRARAAVSTFG